MARISNARKKDITSYQGNISQIQINSKVKTFDRFITEIVSQWIILWCNFFCWPPLEPRFRDLDLSTSFSSATKVSLGTSLTSVASLIISSTPFVNSNQLLSSISFTLGVHICLCFIKFLSDLKAILHWSHFCVNLCSSTCILSLSFEWKGNWQRRQEKVCS